MADGFAITEYPDVPRVIADLDALIAQPIRRLRRDALQGYLDEYFEKRCQSSKAMTTEAAEYIPGGVQHNLAFNMPFPLVITMAAGCHLHDLDGNEYLDFLQAGGPTVLGSNPPEVLEQVIDLLRTCGPSTGLFHEYELKLARFIADHMPAVPMFRMLGSGTEGCMAAIRVARLSTGKKNVVKMGGAYHGWSDQLAYGLRIPGTRHHEAHGVPKYVFRHTQEFFPGDLDALERTLMLNRARGGTAAVLIEPVGPESGTRPLPRDFNAGVRELCDKYGALLIFDEVVTGFRLGMSGAQGYFGVEPDLTVFGKVVAGGYPSAGGLGGKREHMKLLAAGLEAGSKKALVGGTMAANPLSSAAGYFTLVEMERQHAPEKAGAMGDRLTAGLRESIIATRPAVRDLQPGLDRAPADSRHAALRGGLQPDLGGPGEAQGDQGAQDGDGGDGRRLHRRGRDHAGRVAALHERRTLRGHDRPGRGRLRPRVRPGRGSPAVSEAQARRELVDAGHRLLADGLVARTWGNLSVRLDERSMLVTPSGISYPDLTEKMIVRVDLDSGEWAGTYKPSGERKLHSETYRRRPEVMAGVHTHQVAASICAAARVPVPTPFGEVPCAPYALPGTKKITEGTVGALGQGPAVLMANHGAYAVGGTLGEAFDRVSQLERACAAYVVAKRPREGSHMPADPDAPWDPACLQPVQLGDGSSAWLSTAPFTVRFSILRRPLPPVLDDLAQLTGRRVASLRSTPKRAREPMRCSFPAVGPWCSGTTTRPWPWSSRRPRAPGSGRPGSAEPSRCPCGRPC